MGESNAQSTAPVVKMPYEVACSRTDFIFKELKDQFKEEPIVLGNSTENLLFVLWASPKGTFSITASVDGKNVTCLIMEGKDLNILNKDILSAKPTKLH